MFCDEDQGENKSQSKGNSVICHPFIVVIYKQKPSFELGNCDKATKTCSEMSLYFWLWWGFFGGIFWGFFGCFSDKWIAEEAA